MDVIVAPTVVVMRTVVVELVVLSLPKYTMLLNVVVVGAGGVWGAALLETFQPEVLIPVNAEREDDTLDNDIVV